MGSVEKKVNGGRAVVAGFVLKKWPTFSIKITFKPATTP